nr:MAG TPA: major capsid protein [Caudoviricetes sp.]
MAALLETGISNPGQKLSAGDRDALFMKVFSGEVLTAFARNTVMMSRHQVRTIDHGKSASFAVMGRTRAKYLAPGNSLDDQRKKFEHTEKVIAIDGLLTADCLITDIDDAMNHYDVRVEYSRQLGEALAQSADCAIINELANMAAKDATVKENIPDNGTGADKVKGTGKAFEFATGLELSQSAEYGNKIIEGLLAARAAFTKNYVPMGDRYCLLTPEGYSALIKALMPDSANYQALFDPNSGKLQTICGFEVIEVPHLLNDGVDGKHELNTKFTAAGLQGIVFHRSAVGTVKLKDLAMERARRAEYQADQIIAKYAMGHGGLRPEAVGVFVQTAQV